MSPSPSQSSSESPPQSPANLSVVIGAVLGVIGGILIVCIVIYTIRLKRNQKNGEGQSSHGTIVDRAHLASRITPFGSNQNRGPTFEHTPGQDMRVAVRRADGGWDFEHPQTPLTAHFSGPSSSARRQKEQEAKISKEQGKDRDYSLDKDPFDVLPPPAYGQEPGGYINHMA
ncbi:hypothetical protein BDN72DRAFT_841758 [Pluteus cervinus]|uniref:Uncharacterized protein n=1 Tax=Pluteus cervinus TaxID=181527 RepID=A0ACD3ARM5_9AGAR|nr:hypothetical protein BDN72DRAFT_841758 [Pluteus cervinus]